MEDVTSDPFYKGAVLWKAEGLSALVAPEKNIVPLTQSWLRPPWGPQRNSYLTRLLCEPLCHSQNYHLKLVVILIQKNPQDIINTDNRVHFAAQRLI